MSENPKELAWSLAHALGESAPEPLDQLGRLAATVGSVRCLRLLEQATCVQDKGGLLAPGGDRSRTLGGVFFWLARGSVSRAERAEVWPQERARRRQEELDLSWWKDNAGYSALVRTLLAERGEASTVKVTIIGRPRGVSMRGAAVLFVLEAGKAPPLPRGVPGPQGEPLRCMVVVGRRQWDKVAAALQEDPLDSVIVEGYPSLDPRFADGLTVHATKVASKQQSAQVREGQARAPAGAR